LVYDVIRSLFLNRFIAQKIIDIHRVIKMVHNTNLSCLSNLSLVGRVIEYISFKVHISTAVNIRSLNAAGLYNDVTFHVPKFMSSCLRYGCPPTMFL
jgi:hypothetical protein